MQSGGDRFGRGGRFGLAMTAAEVRGHFPPSEQSEERKDQENSLKQARLVGACTQNLGNSETDGLGNSIRGGDIVDLKVLSIPEKLAARGRRAIDAAERSRWRGPLKRRFESFRSRSRGFWSRGAGGACPPADTQRPIFQRQSCTPGGFTGQDRQPND